MDKKKLIEYTRWLLFEMEITPRNNKKVSKKIVNEFLKKNSDKDQDISKEIDEEFESLNGIEQNKFKDEDEIPKDNTNSTYPLNWYVVSQSQGTPHRCPICNGTKKVPSGFYNSTIGISTISTADETCQSCSGAGIIWSKQ